MLKIKFKNLTINKGCCLVFLVVFFLVSYNFANWLTSIRSDVNSLVFDWETSIPLWSWTIIPYWSIHFMYCFAILSAKSEKSLKNIFLQLFSAQIICVSCFLIFPLRFTFERPAVDGFLGLLFDLLMAFDKPFNQAPSLHITLLVILWRFYSHNPSTVVRYIIHIWCFLIGLSVLTTWQHHFFDLLSGLWVGCFCIWLWPENGVSPLSNKQSPKQYHWGLLYFSLFLISFVMAIYLHGLGLCFLWLSGAFLLVSANYLLFGSLGFGKQSNGQFSLAVRILFLPYFIIMWLYSRLTSFKNNPVDLICDNVYFGRLPSRKTLKENQFISIVDLCAELPINHFVGHYSLISTLAMSPLSVEQCQLAAETIEQYQKNGKLLVCCVRGDSHGATAVIAWLLLTKRVANLDEAIAKLKVSRKYIVITKQQQLILRHFFEQCK